MFCTGAGAGSAAGAGMRPLRIMATITASLTPSFFSFLSVSVSTLNTPRSTSMSAISTWSLRPAFDSSMMSRMFRASARPALRASTASKVSSVRRNGT